MRNLLKLLLLSLVITGSTACTAELYANFCQRIENERRVAEEFNEQEFCIYDWTIQINGLNAAKDLSPTQKIHTHYNSAPGVALTTNELEDRVNFLMTKQLECSALWNIPIPV